MCQVAFTESRKLLSILSQKVEMRIMACYILELVMEELRHLDEVAYVRFASVYRQFEDVEAFHE